jgi:DNA-binding PadR family transcriptional regulator
MYFDILMLRVLADAPRHGYEIKKQVERILGGRSINNNTLYPALRRFEDAGVVERVATEPGPGRPPRTSYRLTDTGHDLLQSMIRDADPALLADENEFQMRVAFFADLAPDERLAIIRVRQGLVEESLARLTALRPAAVAEPWGLRVMDHNLALARQELAWLADLAAAASAAGGPAAGGPATDLAAGDPPAGAGQ